jgi:hypothetical protein
MKKDDFVVAAVVYGEMKANILKAHLEDEGIPVYLKYESFGRVTGLMIDGLGEIKIKVPAEFLEEAKKVLEETDGGEETADNEGTDLPQL